MALRGEEVIQNLQDLVLEAMRSSPECAPGGPGLGNVEIEERCGLALSLSKQDHYITYSILQVLVRKDLVEIVRRRRGRITVHFRLL